MPTYLGMPPFPEAAAAALADSQLRHNLAHATGVIRAKRAGVVAELSDWEQLRSAAKAIKDHTLAHLDTYLLRLEESAPRLGVTSTGPPTPPKPTPLSRPWSGPRARTRSSR